uniref:Uncharacterized protein n=1 Tax=Asparagus officinalis TaxID=4686 RepID=Q2AA59_ASPOF|nr:hypothetical protein 18.t00022 [Asparagus officinalis]
MGANSLTAKTIVLQPTIKISVAEEVKYEFDQQKFEEYVSSSSSRSTSSRKRRKVSSCRKTRWFLDLKTQEGDLPATAAVVAPCNDPLASNEARSDETPWVSRLWPRHHECLGLGRDTTNRDTRSVSIKAWALFYTSRPFSPYLRRPNSELPDSKCVGKPTRRYTSFHG